MDRFAVWRRDPGMAPKTYVAWKRSRRSCRGASHIRSIGCAVRLLDEALAVGGIRTPTSVIASAGRLNRNHAFAVEGSQIAYTSYKRHLAEEWSTSHPSDALISRGFDDSPWMRGGLRRASFGQWPGSPPTIAALRSLCSACHDRTSINQDNVDSRSICFGVRSEHLRSPPAAWRETVSIPTPSVGRVEGRLRSWSIRVE